MYGETQEGNFGDAICVHSMIVLLIDIIIYILGLYLYVGFCMCCGLYRISHDCVRLITGVVIVFERPHHRHQRRNDEQIATITEAHSTK